MKLVSCLAWILSSVGLAVSAASLSGAPTSSTRACRPRPTSGSKTRCKIYRTSGASAATSPTTSNGRGDGLGPTTTVVVVTTLTTCPVTQTIVSSGLTLLQVTETVSTVTSTVTSTICNGGCLVPISVGSQIVNNMESMTWFLPTPISLAIGPTSPLKQNVATSTSPSSPALASSPSSPTASTTFSLPGTTLTSEASILGLRFSLILASGGLCIAVFL